MSDTTSLILSNITVVMNVITVAMVSERVCDDIFAETVWSVSYDIGRPERFVVYCDECGSTVCSQQVNSA